MRSEPSYQTQMRARIDRLQVDSRSGLAARAGRRRRFAWQALSCAAGLVLLVVAVMLLTGD